jgi:TRAP-type mannitol/chloroaromatic compound transport system substrate-binding protein
VTGVWPSRNAGTESELTTLYGELSRSNPHFKKMLDSLTAYRSDSYQWLQVAELAYDSFMMRMRTRT